MDIFIYIFAAHANESWNLTTRHTTISMSGIVTNGEMLLLLQENTYHEVYKAIRLQLTSQGDPISYLCLHEVDIVDIRPLFKVHIQSVRVIGAGFPSLALTLRAISVQGGPSFTARLVIRFPLP